MLKRIFMFDVNRVLFFDVNRVLRWNVSRALRRPIPIVLLKMLLAWFAAGIALAVVIPLALRNGLNVPEWIPMIVVLTFMALAVGPELLRWTRKITASRART
jgi:hypothetical protein